MKLSEKEVFPLHTFPHSLIHYDLRLHFSFLPILIWIISTQPHIYSSKSPIITVLLYPLNTSGSMMTSAAFNTADQTPLKHSFPLASSYLSGHSLKCLYWLLFYQLTEFLSILFSYSTLSLGRPYTLFSKIIFSHQLQACNCSLDFSSGSQTYSQAANNLGLLA